MVEEKHCDLTLDYDKTKLNCKLSSQESTFGKNIVACWVVNKNKIVTMHFLSETVISYGIFRKLFQPRFSVKNSLRKWGKTNFVKKPSS